MKFHVRLTSSANNDIQYFKPYEQKIIVAAIKRYLQVDANIENPRRKKMRRNELAPWELKMSKYRVFYNLEDEAVKIIAVGHKEHNELFIRGRRVEL